MRNVRPITTFALLMSFGLLACGGPFFSSSLGTVDAFKNPEYGGLKRASFELECPATSLEVIELAPSTMGVSGCGKKAVYKWISTAGWVNNSAVDDSNTAPKK